MHVPGQEGGRNPVTFQNTYKNRILSSQDTLKLVLKINEYLTNVGYENILVVSSSYLIGQLNYFYNYFDIKKEIFDIEIGKKHEIGGWLKGFEIILV